MPDRSKSRSDPRRPRSRGHSNRAFANSRSESDASDLEEFFAGTALSNGAMSYHEFRGFLFAIVAVPEMILPSEWLPFVFGEQEPKFDTTEQAKRIVGSIMVLYNEISTEISEGRVRLPEDCRFRDDVLSNLSDDAPVSQWSRGFIRGHTWLSESWDEHVPDDLEDQFGTMIMALSFFASRRLAERCLTECTKGDVSLVDLAETMRTVFPGAMADYAGLGRSIHRALMNHQPPQRKGIGRNDTCPCGSRRKYKKCCGANS